MGLVFILVFILFSPQSIGRGERGGENQIENFPFFVFLLPQSSRAAQVKQRTTEPASDFSKWAATISTQASRRSQSNKCPTGNHQNGTSHKNLAEYPQFSILQSAGFSSANPPASDAGSWFLHPLFTVPRHRDSFTLGHKNNHIPGHQPIALYKLQ